MLSAVRCHTGIFRTNVLNIFMISQYLFILIITGKAKHLVRFCKLNVKILQTEVFIKLFILNCPFKCKLLTV